MMEQKSEVSGYEKGFVASYSLPFVHCFGKSLRLIWSSDSTGVHQGDDVDRPTYEFL